MQFTRSQEAALNIDRHICVTAGAGSGKTAVLVERYLTLLRAGISPREIVALTFTDKAAAEMKDRIIQKLSVSDDAALHRCRDQMNAAHISTIHAFCSGILREFPFQAGIPANFGILRGIDQKLVLQESIRSPLAAIATDPEHPDRQYLGRLLHCYGGQKKLTEFFGTMISQRHIVEALIASHYNHTDDPEKFQEVMEQQRRAVMLSGLDIPEFIRCLHAALQIAKGKNAEEVRELTETLAASTEESETLEILREIAPLITTKGNAIAGRDFLGNKVDATEIEDEIEQLVAVARKVKTFGPLTGDDMFLVQTTGDLIALYRRVSDEYRQSKLTQGRLDFADLQLKTRDLLQSNEAIRKELVSRYRYFMIDEYQDTNNLQYDLVMLLTDELNGANLFIVGDPKQSIYAFRGADVTVFQKAQTDILEGDGLDISLQENFRSARAPVAFVNHFFKSLMGEGAESEFAVRYEPLTQARPGDETGSVEILLGSKGDTGTPENRLIAQRIKQLKTEEKLEYGDIAILIRARNHLPDIETALLEADIPYLTTGGIGFYQRQEIYDIWNYLHFLDAPTQNYASLAAVLRGPAFGISDTEIFEISQHALQSPEQQPSKDKRLWEKAQAYRGSPHLQLAIATLKKHAELAHRMPVNQLILTLVNETGLIGTLKTGKYGRQRWANYQKLLELARNFEGEEQKHLLSGFVTFLDTLIKEEPQEGNAPVDADTGAVQIMTLHAAKGKEFPVVIMPSLERRGGTDSEPFIHEKLGIGFSPLQPDDSYRKTEPQLVESMKNQAAAKNTAERKRVFYVGATRARDRLILAGTPDNDEKLESLRKRDTMFGWLFKHLNITDGATELTLPVSLAVYRENRATPQDIELRIPIHREFDTDSDAEAPQDETDAALPAFRSISPDTALPTTFSVSELANYARCPLRYRLENVLRLQMDTDATTAEMNAAVRAVLRRIRNPEDVTQYLDAQIKHALEAHADVTDTALRKCVTNFLESELGRSALSARNTYTSQLIYAEVNTHILTGYLDRLFEDATGHWHAIVHKAEALQDPEADRPEMQLYGLLAHHRLPNRSPVTVNLYFTDQDRCGPIRFSTDELQAIQVELQDTVSALQRGDHRKNRQHCSACPYAVNAGACIITEEK